MSLQITLEIGTRNLEKDIKSFTEKNSEHKTKIERAEFLSGKFFCSI